MMVHRNSEVQLSFDPLALERCYLVADVLDDEFAAPYLEYGLLGLADESKPLHVVATPLLVGQSVTPGSVKQPGRQVLRMRDEMEMLSRRMERRLVPIVFIHRHPASCDASVTDEEFLRGVFVDQVFTVVSFKEVRWIDGNDPPCVCPGVQRLLGGRPGDGSDPVEFESEFGMAFSLIVNRERDHRLYAVRKAMCPFCDRSAVSEVPARVDPDPRSLASELDRAAMRSQLAREIRAKISFGPEREEIERVQ
jgi:hypothetical protein